MKKLDIIIINNSTSEIEDNFELIKSRLNTKLKIIINIYKLDNYELFSLISKLENVLKIYENISIVNIIFVNLIEIEYNKILSKLNNIFYKINRTKKINIYNLESKKNQSLNNNDKSKSLMNELFLYKDISMDPNKTPDTYLKYIISRIPKYYTYKLFNINENQNLFPLTWAVGKGSTYNSYFIHIYPKNIMENKKTIYCIGKAITYDSGGLNLKSRHMEEMKTDMIGSAILISVINLIIENENNIHLLIPIAENMIGPNATKPGTVAKAYNGKTVEIINTDAEGRLCIVDAFNYCQSKNEKCDLILDIATLTGNVEQITGNISSICTSNKLGYKYALKLMEIGDEIGEYIDYLKLRKEYQLILKSEVADIKSMNDNYKYGCMQASAFLNYFVNDKIPWIHIDIASCVFKNDRVLSYGINLLYELLKNEIKIIYR